MIHESLSTDLRRSSSVQLYTFGQPRTGGYVYARSFDALGIRRLVLDSTIVELSGNFGKDNEVFRRGRETRFPEFL